MFKIRLSYGDKDLDFVYLKCINCKRETGLNSKTNFTWVYDEIVTKKMKCNVASCWYVIDNHLQPRNGV